MDWTFHRKRLNVYISLLMILMMMGGTVCDGFVSYGLNDTVLAAKKKSSKKKASGKNRKRKASKGHKTKGKYKSNDHGAASTWSIMKKGGKNIAVGAHQINDSVIKKNCDGYLRPNKKGMSMYVFGGGSGYSKEGSFWKVPRGYTYQKRRSGADDGKVGAVWKNAYTYYDIHHKQKPLKVTVKATLVGHDNARMDHDMQAVSPHWHPSERAMNQISFHKNTVGINAYGAGNDVFQFQLFADGKPLNKRVPFTLKDIDVGQHIAIKGLYDRMHQGTAYYSEPTTWVQVQSNKRAWESDRWDFSGWPHEGLNYNPAKDGSSVATNDKRGFASFLMDPNMTMAFGRDTYAHTNVKRKSASSKLPGKANITVKRHSNDTISDGGHISGNLFEFDAKWKLPQTPIVNTYKTIGKSENEAIFGKKHDLGEIDAKTPFYYGLHTVIDWPSVAYAHGTDDLIKKLNISDSVPKGVEIQNIKIYKYSYLESESKHGKQQNVLKLFDNKSTKTKVDLQLKTKNIPKHGPNIFDGHVVVVVKAKVAKNAPYTEREGNKLKGVFDNKFFILNDHKSGGGGKVTVTKTPGGDEIPKPNPKATKWVYKKTPGTDNWAKGKDVNGITVNPNQALAYRVRFKIKATPSDSDTDKYRYDKLTITDKLDPKLDPKETKNIKISWNSASGGTSSGCELDGDTIKVKLDRAGVQTYLDDMKNGGYLYLNYETKVKGYKPAEGDKVENQAHMTSTIGHTHREQNEDGSYTPWDPSLDATYWDPVDSPSATSNKTINPVEQEVQGGNKEAYSQNPDGKITPGTTTLSFGDTMEFRISSTVGVINDTVGDYYKKFELSDDFSSSAAKNLTIKSAVVYKTKDGSLNADKSNGSQFATGSIDGRKVSWKANPKSFDMKGETYTLVIKVKYDREADETYTDDDPVFHNKGHWTIGTKGDVTENQSTNVVDVGIAPTQSSVGKEVTAIKDTYTGKDVPLGNAMDPRDNHDVTFTLTAITGNTHPLPAHLTDTLPENMTVIPGSIKTDVQKNKGYDQYSEAAGSVSVKTTKSTTAGGKTVDTIDATINKKNVVTTVTFTAHLSGESDWSDYYNANGGEMHYNNGVNHVTDDSYLSIKNYDNLTFGDGKAISGFASFNMGCQTFHTAQYIAQDDNKWVNHLDPSHYNPVKGSQVRNNKTAVTTVIKLQMPNYMKLDGLDIDNESLTPGFDKGWSTIRRANLKLVHGDMNALPNFDLGPDQNLDGSGIKAPYSDWHEPDNPPRFNTKGVESYSNLQSATETSYGDSGEVETAPDGAGKPIKEDQSTDGTSFTDYAGKTYYHIQKWNPKTRYYHDYEKLPTLETGFKGSVYLIAHALGQRSYNDTNSGQTYKGTETIDHTFDKNDQLNNVGIHLSNIYGYTTLSDKATYSQDGKTVKYKTYGQQLGLAVDKRNKTQFMDPGKPGSYVDSKLKPESQPIEAYIGNNTNVLKLKSDLGTGEESIIENTKSSPAPDNDKDYASGYKGNETYKVTDHKKQKDDNAQWNKLDITQFWQLTGEGNSRHWIARPVKHGYTSDSDLTEVKGHSVTITIPRVDHDETLVKTREANIKFDPYKKIVFTTNPDVKNVQYKNNFEVKQVGQNQEATNPKKFITYFDFNKDWSHDATPVQRVLKEAYEFVGPNYISAKSGNNIQENHKLATFTYHNDMDRARLLNDYRTNLSSKDSIFDPGYTKTANDEALSMSFDVLRGDNDVNKALQTDKNSNEDILSLLGGRQFFIKGIGNENEYQITRAREDWRPILPNYRLTVMSYRFNNRVLKDGKQAYAKSEVDYPDYNTNVGGFDYTDSDVTRGGFRNYIKHDIGLGTYPLNWRTTTNNKGLLGDIGFGIGYATSIDYTQQLRINGSRYLVKKGPHGLDDSKTAEIAIDPVISGRDAQKIKGFSDKQNQFIKDNDSGSLSKYNK